jgi:Protein of unknown function (DUF2752)
MKTKFPFLKYIDREAFIWFVGLLYLAFIHSNFTICPLKLLGFEYCPGCGMGLSIHYLLNFSLKESFNAHPFGPSAFIIIVHRIYSLQKSPITELIKKNKLGVVHE